MVVFFEPMWIPFETLIVSGGTVGQERLAQRAIRIDPPLHERVNIY